MSAFFERVRAALAPKGYEVLRELGSGGMGIVVLARQVKLDRLVAVKVIRPEMHTAVATERFRREAMTLAGLSHPNIVPVYEADEADGLPYYTMQYLQGETLADRLRNGPMLAEEVRKLGRDLLEALEEAHTHGVVHRDVKPSNVFLTDGRAVLVDFGIAKRVPPEGDASRGGEELTAPGLKVGTRGYMSPEQLGGAEATPASDLYAAALVIYEAYTDRHWLEAQHLGRHAWSGVSRREARVVRRALAWRAEGRWPDAASFRRRLWHTRVWPYQRNAIGIAIGCTILGLLIHSSMPVPSTLRFRVEARTSAVDPESARGDSVACALARGLDRYPELSAHCVSGLGRWLPGGSHIRVETANEAGRLRIRLRGSRVDTIEIVGQPAEWRSLAESLADRIFGAQLGSTDSLDRSLPRGVLPKNALGRRSFQRAEGAFARGRWGEARAGYAEAAALDSTCWLCYWRHAEVGRWFDLEDDPTDRIRYLAHIKEFPDYYRTLIRAQGLPLAARLDSLDALIRRSKDFLFGQFRRADELLHRGPLVGRSRREAMQSFQDVLKIQAEFVPALEHVAWLNVAEGDSTNAAAALALVAPHVDPKDPSFATLAIVELAYAWRFLPRPEAERRTRELVRMARAAGIKDLDAGARYLAGFGAPHGELAFAEQLLPEPGFARSASLARVLALVGMGRPDTALVLAQALAYRFPELEIFVSELAAVLVLADVDSAAAAGRWAKASLALEGAADAGIGRVDWQGRAGWLLATVELARSKADRPRRAGSSAAPPEPLATLLRAQAAAARGAADSALVATRALTGIPGQDSDDPFFRTVLHLARAAWSERGKYPVRAMSDFVWHENSDLHGYPNGDPQPAEVDWAFATFAQWRLGELLERVAHRPEEACRAYGTVVRLWAGGEPPYRARADTAARRLVTLGCKAAG
jgi:serine/threonine protein kinase